MGTVNRSVALVAAIAIALTGWLITPASAEEPSPYTVTFVRDANCANTGTFIIRGLPGNTRIRFVAGWSPDQGPPFSSVYGGFSFNGKGGSRPAVWRQHFTSPSVVWAKMPKKPFSMGVTFQVIKGAVEYRFDLIVPACTR